MAVTDLTGTKWRFNTNPNFSIPLTEPLLLYFTSNNRNFITIRYGVEDGPDRQGVIVYNDGNNPAIAYYGTTWLDQAYRLIEITGGTDATNANLISFIQSNAEQIIDSPVLPSFSDVEVTPHEGYITMTINGVDFNLKTAASVSLISFKINYMASVGVYQAEEGMTWAEWLDSTYNTSELYVDENNGFVTSGSLLVSGPSGYVNASDEIISRYVYGMSGGGAGD